MKIDGRSAANSSRARRPGPKVRRKQPEAPKGNGGVGELRRHAERPAPQARAAPDSRRVGRDGRGAGDTRRTGRDGVERTCVGCGKTDTPPELVRLVVSPEGDIAVDLAGGRFGRGAYIHPTMACVSGVSRGLSRSLRRQVVMQPETLAQRILEASERRIGGLLSSAVRSRQTAAGADSVAESLASGQAALVVVARDAAAAASVGAVAQAVADGRAVAFGTKAELGALFGRAEVGVMAITNIPLATAIRRTALVAGGIQLVRPGAEKRAAKASHNATRAEDR